MYINNKHIMSITVKDKFFIDINLISTINIKCLINKAIIIRRLNSYDRYYKRERIIYCYE